MGHRLAFSAAVTVTVSLSIWTSAAREQDAEAVRAQGTVALHVIDVEGLALVLDMGTKEIVIDGGNNRDALLDYLSATGIVDPPIELVIVSHAHADHYQGLTKVLEKFVVDEIWDSGFDSEATQYRRLLETIQALPATRLVRPLAKTHVPAVESGAPQPFHIPSLPDVTFTVLSADYRAAEGRPAKVNDTSIVVKVEVAGTTFLFPGDATGKDSFQPSTSTPKFVEGQMVALLHQHPDALRADVLVAPFHGSAAAGTDAFVDAVAPRMVIFGAMKRFGLPLRTTIARYSKAWRQLFQTSQDNSHAQNIVVEAIAEHTLQGQYRVLHDGAVRWEGRLPNGSPVSDEELNAYCKQNNERLRTNRDQQQFDVSWLRGAVLAGARLAGCVLNELDLTNIDLTGADLRNVTATGATLTKGDLSHSLLEGAQLTTEMRGTNLTGIWWPHAALAGADLANANLMWAQMEEADLSGATLSSAVLSYARMPRATVVGTGLSEAQLRGSDLSSAIFEPLPGQIPGMSDLMLAPYLAGLRFKDSPHALVALRKAFKEAGLRQQERALTFAIEHERPLRTSQPERAVKYWLLELPTQYGLAPNRPLLILLILVGACAVGYYVSIETGRRAGIVVVIRRRLRAKPGDFKVRLWRLRVGRRRSVHGFRVSRWRAVRTALALSSVNALNLKVQWLDAGVWLRMLRKKNYDLEGVGFARSLAGAQSLLSMYLIALWLLMYFGNPFE